MGTFSIWHWLIVLAIVILLFGRGRIPELMGDVAKGIKNFKKGMSDDTKTDTAETKRSKNLLKSRLKTQHLKQQKPASSSVAEVSWIRSLNSISSCNFVVELLVT